MGTDIVHAGGVGAGQVLKIMNNMVLFINMNAIAEALAIGRAAGVDPQKLFSTLALGSADSFALRNTATATMIPDAVPRAGLPGRLRDQGPGARVAAGRRFGRAGRVRPGRPWTSCSGPTTPASAPPTIR